MQQQKAEQQRLKYEKELSAAQALIKAGANREVTLQNQIETLRQTLHEADLKTAVAEALYGKNQKAAYFSPKDSTPHIICPAAGLCDYRGLLLVGALLSLISSERFLSMETLAFSFRLQ